MTFARTLLILTAVSAGFDVGAADTGAADPAPTPPPSAPGQPAVAPTCVAAPPRIAGLGRATLQTRCGSRDGLAHKGDAIALQARGHFRLEAELDSGSQLEVTCVSSSEPITATIGDGQAPWFHLDGDVSCGAWTHNEQVCARQGVEVLVCGAATQRPRALAARPLGLPTWYLGEAPEPEPSSATATADAATPEGDVPPTATTEKSEKSEKKRLLRVVMQEPQAVGIASERLMPIFTGSLTTELRKRRGVTVVSLDELRALVEQEGQRQLVGCTDESCLSEIADALDADVIVSAQLSEVGEEHTLFMRRLSTRDAHATEAFELRFPRGNGEGFLGAVGPAVARLFPDHPLRDGETLGVDKEAAYLLNPPPLSPWVLTSTVGAGIAAAGVAAGVGAFTVFEVSRIEERLAQSTATVVDGAGLVADHERAVTASVVAWSAAGVSALILGGALVLVPFTNFDERPIDERAATR